MWKDLPLELGRLHAHRGPIGRDRGGRAPSPMSSSVDSVICPHLLVSIGVDLMVSSHPSVSSKPRHTCEMCAEVALALQSGEQIESCSYACRSALLFGVRAHPGGVVRNWSGGCDEATNMLSCEAVGRSKSLDVIGIVSERMDLIRGEIEWSQVRVSFGCRFCTGSRFFSGG
jgi:hypothetical protein